MSLVEKKVPNGLQNYLKVDADFDFTLDKKEEVVKVNYYVNHMKINNRRGPANYLVIIPGYSVKSFCWDVESVLQYQSILVEKGFTDVLIFNLGGCKYPKSKFSKAGKRDELDQLITKYVKMCLVEAFNFTEKPIVLYQVVLLMVELPLDYLVIRIIHLLKNYI